jgi:hypothetical protein
MNPNSESEFQTIPSQSRQNRKIFPHSNLPVEDHSHINEDIDEFSPLKKDGSGGGQEKRFIGGDRDDEERRSMMKRSIFGDAKDESKILKEQFGNSIVEGDIRLSMKREDSSNIHMDFEILQRKYIKTNIQRKVIENINLTFCLECQNFLEIDNTSLHNLFCRQKTTKPISKPKKLIFNSQISYSKENLLKKLDNLDKLIFTKPSSYSSSSPQSIHQTSTITNVKQSSKSPNLQSNPASSGLRTNSGASTQNSEKNYLKTLEGVLIGVLERIKEEGGSAEIVEDLNRLKNCYLTQEKGIGQRYLLVISRVKEIVEGYLQGKDGEWIGEN